MHVQKLYHREGPAVAARVAAKRAADEADKQLAKQAGKQAGRTSRKQPVSRKPRKQPISRAAGHAAGDLTPEQGAPAAEPTEAMCSDGACSSGGHDGHDSTAQPHVGMQPDMGSSAAEHGLVTACRQCSQVMPAQPRPQEVQKSQGQPLSQAGLPNDCGQLQYGGHAQTLRELEPDSHTSNVLQQSSAGLQQYRHDGSIASEGLQLEQATSVRKSSKRAADDCLDPGDPEAGRRRKSQKLPVINIAANAHSNASLDAAAQAHDTAMRDAAAPSDDVCLARPSRRKALRRKKPEKHKQM